jgi:Oxidoreductase family, NAD-binding Rossmann fold
MWPGGVDCVAWIRRQLEGNPSHLSPAVVVSTPGLLGGVRAPRERLRYAWLLAIDAVAKEDGIPLPGDVARWWHIASGYACAVMIIGVLGLGRIGAIHAANLASLADVELVVFDPDPNAVQRTTEATGARSLPDRDALIAESDAIVIATSTANHPDDLMAGLAAALPMFCEKPISLDVASTAAAVEAVERAGVELQVGFQRRFDPGFVEMRRLVESGELGDLYLLRAATHDHLPPNELYLGSAGSMSRLRANAGPGHAGVSKGEEAAMHARGGPSSTNNAPDRLGIDGDNPVRADQPGRPQRPIAFRRVGARQLFEEVLSLRTEGEMDEIARAVRTVTPSHRT